MDMSTDSHSLNSSSNSLHIAPSSLVTEPSNSTRNEMDSNSFTALLPGQSASRIFSVKNLPRRAMSISYITKVLHGTKQDEGVLQPSQDDDKSISHLHTKNAPGKKVPLKKNTLPSFKSESGSQPLNQWGSVSMPHRASVDLSMPLDPTLLVDSSEAGSIGRRSKHSSIRADDFMDIEKQGELVFNASVRSHSSMDSPLEVSPLLDPDVRLSTAEAKRWSIVNMNNNINSRPYSVDGSNSDTNSLNYDLKTFELNDPTLIKRRMSLQKQSFPSFGSRDSNQNLSSLNKSSSNSLSNTNNRRRRNSSMLASGDVLSIKRGVFHRTKSTGTYSSATGDSELDVLDVYNDHQLFGDTAEKELSPSQNEPHVLSADDEEIIAFNTSKLGKSVSPLNKRERKYDEIDPLEDQQLSPRSPSSTTHDKDCYSYMAIKKPYVNVFTENERSIKERVKYIAENTRNQLRRSTIISAHSQGSETQDLPSQKLESNSDLSSKINFPFIKRPDSPSVSIDLNDIESTENLSEENLNKVDWNSYL